MGFPIFSSFHAWKKYNEFITYLNKIFLSFKGKNIVCHGVFTVIYGIFMLYNEPGWLGSSTGGAILSGTAISVAGSVTYCAGCDQNGNCVRIWARIICFFAIPLKVGYCVFNSILVFQ